MHNKPILIQFLGFFVIAILSLAIFKEAGTLLADFLFSTNIFQLGMPSSIENEATVNALKVIQLFTALGVFIFPPLIFTMIFKKEAWGYLDLNKNTTFVNYPTTIFIMLGALPLINFFVGINEAITLPASLKAVEQALFAAEKQAEQIIQAFLNVDSLSGLAFNLVLIALIPAIGEELFFRGIVQKLLMEWTKHAWLAIVISGIIFSALHFQFYGFIPRMMMGILLGYLFYWTGSLWIPILAHFTNNAAAVIMYYFIHNGKMDKTIDELGKQNDEIAYVIASAGLVIFTLLYFYKNRETNYVSEG